jgi:hypothetical protein
VLPLQGSVQPYVKPSCPAANINFAAAIPGSSFQWQLNTGNGYTNISNNSFYSGTNTDAFRITTAPTSWYGYQYRCAVTSNYGLVYSPAYVLKFGMNWLGIQSNDWNNPLNWGCGLLPDAQTDVIIKGGVPNLPQLTGTASIRSLSASPAAGVTVKTGGSLLIKN